MYIVRIGIGKGGLLADDVHRLDLTLVGSLHHQEVAMANLIGKRFWRNAPAFGPAFSHFIVSDMSIAGVAVAQAAKVTRALHIVVTTHRIAARAGPAIVAGNQ